MQPLFDEFFSFLRFSLDIETRNAIQENGTQQPPTPPFSRSLTSDEWKWLHEQAMRQCLLGVLYKGIEKLPTEHRPPRDILLRWTLEANQIAALNDRMNKTAAKVTKMFADRGVRTVILKGQANARFYPDPNSRQAGDIDIFIYGGYKYVLDLLQKMNLTKSLGYFDISNVHVHLDERLFEGITVEAHFVPTINYSPFSTRKMNHFLNEELATLNAKEILSEGFNVPSMKFALTMQLSHMQRHFIERGLGLRQLLDYNQLLQNSTIEDRAIVSQKLKKFNLFHMAGAVMWILKEFLNLNESLMLCKPDKKRGKLLLSVVIKDGNFGKYAKINHFPKGFYFFANSVYALKRATFNFSESIWYEYHFFLKFIKSIPVRVKNKRFSLRGVR